MLDSKNHLLGNLKFLSEIFTNINKPFVTSSSLFDYYNSKEFQNKNSIQRNKVINDNLIDLIKNEKSSFCLFSIVNYLEHVSSNHLLDGPYNLSAFERYLNQESQLEENEKYLIRAKIVGKFIPREEYQVYFPVGKGQRHYGTHTVTAHNPPDLDSTTASFIGWLDAFGCHVSDSLTIWNVPQGKPGELVTSFVDQILDQHIFTRVAKERSFISTVAMDIVKQTNLYRAQLTENIRELSHSQQKTHIIAVDKDGYYCGDWRVADTDTVGSIQRYLNMWFHYYEKEFINKMLTLFINKDVYLNDVEKVIDSLLNQKVLEFDLFTNQYNQVESNTLNQYLCLLLNTDVDYQVTKRQLLENFDTLGKTKFRLFCEKISSFADKQNYCSENKIILSRDEIFIKIQQAFENLRVSVTTFRHYTEQLEIALKIKTKMLGFKSHYVTTKSLLSEIRQLIQQTQYSHITVNYADMNGKLIPVGVLDRTDIYRNFLGTVSLRDFSNRDEIKLGNDIKVISIIDHHRSDLSSSSVATIKIEDVQSCNTLLAQQAFQINDSYAKKGDTLQQVEKELLKTSNLNDENLKIRLQKKLLQRKHSLLKNNHYFIDPLRELTEYLLFLNAIIDDTDLLAKAGWRDLYIIVELLNRIKSWQIGETVEIVDISEILPVNANISEARNSILKNEDMYSFYKGIYSIREKVGNETIQNANQKGVSPYFVDRKIQKSCCSVSQFKLFSNNWKTFLQNRNVLINRWLSLNDSIHLKTPEVDFFLQMNSTVCSYAEAHKNCLPNNGNKDEIWLSVDQESDSAIARLVQFIKQIATNRQEIELEIFVEGQDDDWGQTLLRSLNDQKTTQAIFNKNKEIKQSLITLIFKQASLNSRKADITPHLPV